MQDDQAPDLGVAADTPGWQFTDGGKNDAPGPSSSQTATTGRSVAWTASEFIAHDKSVAWYGLLLIVTLAVAAGTYYMTSKDKYTPAIVLIAGILFGIVAARKPRELPYKIDSKGVKIGDKVYPFAEFKSFSLVQEESIEAIWLLPLKRFVPGLSIYFSPDDKPKILEILDDYLPVEQRQLDFVDRLMHKIRF